MVIKTRYKKIENKAYLMGEALLESGGDLSFRSATRDSISGHQIITYLRA